MRGRPWRNLGDRSDPRVYNSLRACLLPRSAAALRLPYTYARLNRALARRRLIMKKLWLLVALVALGPGLVSAQTTDELVNDGKNHANVTTQSMGFYRQNYSPLKEIIKSNVRRLVPVWN